MQHRQALHLVLIAVHSLVLRDPQQLHSLIEEGLKITVHCAYVTELARPLSLFQKFDKLPFCLRPSNNPPSTHSCLVHTVHDQITLVTLPSILPKISPRPQCFGRLVQMCWMGFLR